VRVLIVGNSQAGVLKSAHDANPGILGVDPFFFVVPGGTGPYMRAEDDRMIVTGTIEGFPPRINPPEADSPLSTFDAVVVSALGYADGGWRYQNPITTSAFVPDFSPKATGELASPAAFRQIVYGGLQKQLGFVFLDSLRATYRGPIILQPFPRLSERLPEREDWQLRRDYDNFLEMHHLIERARCDFLSAKAKELDIVLLPFPFEDPWWTPATMMRDDDMVHVNVKYGSLVLEQIAHALNAFGAGVDHGRTVAS
jgi:hypothetical protein